MQNYLIHYGRSKKDGAPGPGTGNYPRDGSKRVYSEEVERLKNDPSNAMYYLNRWKEKRQAKKQAKKDAKFAAKKQKWSEDIGKLKKHAKVFTAAEMEEAVRKLSAQVDYETKLTDLSAKRLEVARRYTSQLAYMTKDTADILSNAYNVYKNVDSLIKMHTDKKKPKTELQKVQEENTLVSTKRQLEENKQALAALTDEKNKEVSEKINELNRDTALRNAEVDNMIANNPEVRAVVTDTANKVLNDLWTNAQNTDYKNAELGEKLIKAMENLTYASMGKDPYYQNNKGKK